MNLVEEVAVALQPCPFCGSEAVAKSDGWASKEFPKNDPIGKYFWVKCQNPKCAVSPAATSSIQSAVEAWNLRS